MAVTGHCPKLAPEWNGNLDEVSATDLAAPGTGQSSLSPTIHATIQIQSRRHICNAQVFPVLLPKSPCTAPQRCGAAVSCCSLLLSQNPPVTAGASQGCFELLHDFSWHPKQLLQAEFGARPAGFKGSSFLIACLLEFHSFTPISPGWGLQPSPLLLLAAVRGQPVFRLPAAPRGHLPGRQHCCVLSAALWMNWHRQGTLLGSMWPAAVVGGSRPLTRSRT